MVEVDQSPRSSAADVGPCGTGVSPVNPGSVGVSPANRWAEFGPRTFGYGKMGNLDRLCGIMSPGKTVSKLRSTPAPCLAQAPALKLGVGVDLNRCRDRVGCLLGPDTVLTRSRSHRGANRISAR